MVAPRLREKTRKERIRLDAKTYPFAACSVAIENDININLIYRSLANFGGREFFIIGSKNWHPGASNGIQEHIKISYFKTINEFLTYIKNTEYSLVAVEQSENSELLHKTTMPLIPCFMFGNETVGLGDDVLLNADKILEIQMDGFHPCLNVGCCASIVMYDFIRRSL